MHVLGYIYIFHYFFMIPSYASVLSQIFLHVGSTPIVETKRSQKKPPKS